MVLVGAGLASTFPVILSIVGSRYASLSGTAFSVALVIALIGQTLLNSLGNYLARIQYRCVSLYDDCLPAHHASFI